MVTFLIGGGMVNIIVGLIAVVLGLWGIVAHWFATIDLVTTLLPIILVIYGIIATIAGIKRFSKDTASQEEESGLG